MKIGVLYILHRQKFVDTWAYKLVEEPFSDLVLLLPFTCSTSILLRRHFFRCWIVAGVYSATRSFLRSGSEVVVEVEKVPVQVHAKSVHWVRGAGGSLTPNVTHHLRRFHGVWVQVKSNHIWLWCLGVQILLAIDHISWIYRVIKILTALLTIFYYIICYIFPNIWTNLYIF